MNDVLNEDRVREIIQEELANFTPPKKKRAPSKWQLFLKDCVKEQDSGLVYTEKVKKCSVEYKEKKKENNGNNKDSSNSNQIIPQGFDMLSNKQLDRIAKLSNEELAKMANKK